MLPKQKDIEIPLLEALMEIGGEGKPKNIFPLVTKIFPELTEDDLAETLKTGANRWKNRIRWARQSLVQKGEIDKSISGIWAITDKGRKRLLEKGKSSEESEIQSLSFVEVYENYEALFRSQILEKINELEPRQFELFAPKLLKSYGFSDINVTKISDDGGIDGDGKLRLGLASMNAAFQCKRWQGNVGRTEVDKFRGAIQGEFEQGIFLTTSDFTKKAREASLKKGAVPIILLNGESIVDIMIQKGIGVERIPLYLYYECPVDFLEENLT